MRAQLLRITVGLTLIAIFVPAGRGAEAAVGCNTTITANTKLTADVGPDCQNGITIGKSRIVLDLNGRTIDGNSGTGAGVIIPATVSRVTIKNGTIQQFQFGVSSRASRVTLSNLRVTANIYGADWRGTGSVLNSRFFSNTSFGFASQGPLPGPTSFVRDSFIGNFNFGASFDMQVFVTASFFTGNGEGMVLSGRGAGSGITKSFFNGNVAAGAGNGDGASTAGVPDVAFSGNIANYNSGWGINAHPSVLDGGNNLAKGNGQSRQCVSVSCN